MSQVRDIRFQHRRSADQARGQPQHHPVIIVGAGPVGLVAALELARKGHRSLVIDKKDNLSAGSRAICWAKRSLEVMDRLALGDALIAKGVTWQTGKVFFDTRRVFEFDLLPERGHRRPAFINLQQYHFEHFCIEAAAKTDLIELRWQEEVQGFELTQDGALLTMGTPEGDYRLLADWVIAADGARSHIRRSLDLAFEGRVFHDQFLICDIKMRMERPAERWFWFDPPFNRGRSALLHKQADDVWRLDFQLDASADPAAAIEPASVARRVRAMLGETVEFSFEWISLYRFQSRRLQRFRHGRVLFAGDAAHQMSPFGARGGNSGIQDVDNLIWKLDLVLRGRAPEALLDSYDWERVAAADENLLNTTRSTDFIAPKSAISRAFRDGVLALAATQPLARRLVNSGRLSVASTYDQSPLNGPDGFAAGECPATRPGAAALDAPLGDAWLLDALGSGFVAVGFCREDASARAFLDASGGVDAPLPWQRLLVTDPVACARYGAERAPAYYLFRPDQHVAARWRRFAAADQADAVARASGWAARPRPEREGSSACL
jgi:3-(3-hydroxy-phenyl)propionate hydroxylase